MAGKFKKFLNDTVTVGSIGVLSVFAFKCATVKTDDTPVDRRHFENEYPIGLLAEDPEYATNAKSIQKTEKFDAFRVANPSQKEKSIVNFEIDLHIYALHKGHNIVKSYEKPAKQFGYEPYCVIAASGCQNYTFNASGADYARDYISTGLSYDAKRGCQAFIDRIASQYPGCIKSGKISDLKKDLKKGSVFIRDNKKSKVRSTTKLHYITISDTKGSDSGKTGYYIGYNGNNKGQIPAHWVGYLIDTEKALLIELSRSANKIKNNKKYKTDAQRKQAVEDYIDNLYDRTLPQNKNKITDKIDRIGINDIIKYSKKGNGKYAMVQKIENNKAQYYATLKPHPKKPEEPYHSTPEQPFSFMLYNKLQNEKTA